jgi:hypothetical protein
MLQSSKILLLVFLFFIFIGTSYNYAQGAIDSVFVNWNKATISSLERQIKSKTDSVQRSRYENRRSVITDYLNIENVAGVNTESIRYRFLKKIFQHLENRRVSKFYIIEANESGSKVLLRIFFVYIDSMNNANIEFYTNVNQAWQKRGSCQINNFYFEEGLKGYITQQWKGFNDDDIIVTKFDKNVVQESEYFLYGTFSNTSCIKKILDCYRKENFIK